MSPREELPIRRWEWLGLALCVLFGALYRAWAVTQAPGFWYDEAIYALDGLGVLREPGWPVFFDTYGHMREPLFMYFLAPAFAFFGVTVEVARGTSAFIGTLTIPVLWLAARESLGPRKALLAAALCVLFRWHVHFSSLCFRTILTPLLAALLLWSAARFVRRPSAAAAALCGVVLGAGAYTYLAWRLVPAALLLFLLLGWWRSELVRCFLRAQWRGVLLAAGVALLVVTPLLVNFARHPEHFRGRAGEVALTGREVPASTILARQVRDVALLFLIRGDHVGKHNIPGMPTFAQVRSLKGNRVESAARWQDARGSGNAPDVHGTGWPVFDLVTGMAFYAALLWLAARAWRGEVMPLLLLCWLVVGSLASILSFGAPNMLRLTLLIPAVLLVLSEAAAAALNTFAERGRKKAGAALVALLLANFAVQETAAHRAWLRHPMVPMEFNPHLAQLGHVLRDAAPPTVPRYVPAALADAPTLRFILDGVDLRADTTTPAMPRVEAHPAPPFPQLSITPAPSSRELPLVLDGTNWGVVRVVD